MKKYKLALAMISLPLLAHAATSGEILHVNNYQDDGSEGTLRWAIEKNNQNPGNNTIAIDAVGKAPYVITVKSPLPPVKGPVTIAGSDWSRNGTYVASTVPAISARGPMRARGPFPASSAPMSAPRPRPVWCCAIPRGWISAGWKSAISALVC